MSKPWSIISYNKKIIIIWENPSVQEAAKVVEKKKSTLRGWAGILFHDLPSSSEEKLKMMFDHLIVLFQKYFLPEENSWGSISAINPTPAFSLNITLPSTVTTAGSGQLGYKTEFYPAIRNSSLTSGTWTIVFSAAIGISSSYWTQNEQ